MIERALSWILTVELGLLGMQAVAQLAGYSGLLPVWRLLWHFSYSLIY